MDLADEAGLLATYGGSCHRCHSTEKETEIKMEPERHQVDLRASIRHLGRPSPFRASRRGEGFISTYNKNTHGTLFLQRAVGVAI